MKSVILIILILLLMLSSAMATDDVFESSILQFNLNRFYFPAGSESLVYKDCRFVILNEADTVYSGYIQASFLGVSYSYPIDSLSDTLQIENYKVVIYPVMIDSLAEIKIGYTSPYQISFESMPESNEQIKYLLYENNFEMILDFESGNLDAFYSYSRYSNNLDNKHTFPFPAPYYIAIIPNPASSINKNAFLTTSLYYRYDPDLMSILFQGDQCRTINCLTNNDADCNRYYFYDPYRGQSLIRQYKPLPKSITIGITDRSWNKTAEYYADILSRDKIRTAIENKTNRSDFSLAPVPFDKKNNITSLKYIYNILCSDTISGIDINETINIIGDYITSAEKATDTLIEKHYLHLAETALWDEIGVFPLYQPTIFFTAHNNIAGYTADSTGYIDQKQFYKIILPEPFREVNP
ncbi:MAG: hypothetical protein ABIJ12_01125 [bacterium]